jgi:carbohydrate-selective porin OprB
MPRVDKTESAIGVVRANLELDVVSADFDKVFGVGLNASGHVVKGAGQTGIIGVINPGKYSNKAGRNADIFVLADIVDNVGLAAGTTYWADGVTGALAAGVAGTGAQPVAGTGSTAGSVRVGYTVEADRLIVRL